MLTRALLNRQATRTLFQTKTVANSFIGTQTRMFADVSVVKDTTADQVESIESKNARLGVDTKFDQQKHAYVLTFPWNFPEIVNSFETRHHTISEGSYWGRYVNRSRADVDFNNLFREFHQYCSVPDEVGIKKICEPRLAEAVNQSVKRIHFHGLDVEMANLTVEQPSIKVLKVEIHHGLNVNRSQNGSAGEYTTTQSSFLGAPTTYYIPKNDTRDVFDFLDSNRKPYLIAITTLIESPMKMFIQNQNYSNILFGSNDRELVKNVVRFEANVRWTDLLKVLPVNNKPSLKWKITDFNNLMNENPYF